jgi:hypothetical protein
MLKTLFCLLIVMVARFDPDPVVYFQSNIEILSQRYHFHYKKVEMQISSIKEAQEKLDKIEAFAALTIDSLRGDLGTHTMDSFYKNPYKIKYIVDHQLMTPHKHFYGKALDSLKTHGLTF